MENQGRILQFGAVVLQNLPEMSKEEMQELIDNPLRVQELLRKAFPVSGMFRRVATVIANGAEKFIANEECLKEANVGLAGDNFRESFLGKVEENILDVILAASRLEKNSLDGPILAELGTKAEISLAHMFDLLKKQSKGQAGILLTNGSANIFYIRDVKGNLWAVLVYWRSGRGYWDVEAVSVEHQFRWIAGVQVFARD